jgi:hypothetical protein
MLSRHIKCALLSRQRPQAAVIQHQEAAWRVLYFALLLSMLAEDGNARDLLAELGFCVIVQEAAREYEDVTLGNNYFYLWLSYALCFKERKSSAGLCGIG